MTQWQEWSLTIKWEMFCEGESLREKVPRCQGLGWCSLRPLASAGAEVSSGREIRGMASLRNRPPSRSERSTGEMTGGVLTRFYPLHHFLVRDTNCCAAPRLRVCLERRSVLMTLNSASSRHPDTGLWSLESGRYKLVHTSEKISNC